MTPGIYLKTNEHFVLKVDMTAVAQTAEEVNAGSDRRVRVRIHSAAQFVAYCGPTYY